MANLSKFAGMVWYDEASTISKAVFDKMYEKFKLEKEEIRIKLIEDLEFQIDILEQAWDMNIVSRGKKFLGWSDDHTSSLFILKNLLVYLKNNKDNWTHEYYFSQINKIPTYETQDVPSQDKSSLSRNDR